MLLPIRFAPLILFAVGLGLCPHADASAVTWTGETNTQITEPANWSLKALPGPTDTALSNNGGLANQPRVDANFTVAQWNHSAGTLTVEWTLTAPVNLSSSGVLDVRLGGKIVGNLTQDGGLLRGDGTIEGDWTAFSGARMDGNGALQFTGHAALDGQLQFDLSTVTFAGQSFDVDVFSAGSISGNFKTFDLTGLPSDYIAVGQVVTAGLTQAYVLHLSPVSTVSEPAGPLLGVAGLAVLGLSRRCWRRKRASLEVVAVEPARHRARL